MAINEIVVRIQSEVQRGSSFISFAVTSKGETCFVGTSETYQMYDLAGLDEKGSIKGMYFRVTLGPNQDAKKRATVPYMVTDVIEIVDGFDAVPTAPAEPTPAQTEAKPRSPLQLAIDEIAVEVAEGITPPDPNGQVPCKLDIEVHTLRQLY